MTDIQSELVDIPSGMGGILPAAVAEDRGDELTVICLHPEYYNNWVLTVKREDCKPCTYKLTEEMKAIINSRRIQ